MTTLLNETGATLDLEGVADRDFALSFVIVDENGAPFSLTGATPTLAVYGPAGSDPVTTFTAGTPSGAGSNVFTMTLSKAATKSLGVADWRYSLTILKDSITSQWLKGEFRLVPAGYGVDKPASSTQRLIVGSTAIALQVSTAVAGADTAGSIKVTAISGVTGSTVQAVLESLAAKIATNTTTISTHTTQITAAQSAITANATEIATKLPLAGGDMSGNIGLPGGPALLGKAARITAVDSQGRLAINNVEVGTVRRNVVGDLLNGWTSFAGRDPVLTRSANRVQFTAYLNVPTSMASWAYLITYGYRPYVDQNFSGRYLGGSLISPVGGVWGSWYVDDNSGLILKPTSRIDGLIVHISWITVDPWPSTYPGIAA